MAKPASQADLKEYALRQLGKPVINIEIDDAQAADAIDDTLQYFLEYHIDGYEKTAIFHEIRKSEYDKGYLTLPSETLSVTKVFQSNTHSYQAINDYQYQFYRDFYWSTIGSGLGTTEGSWDLVNYYMYREFMGTMDQILDPEIWFSFNPITNNLKTNRELPVYSHNYSIENYSESPNYIVVIDEDNIVKKEREAEIDGELYTITDFSVDDSVSPAETTIYFDKDIPASPTPTEVTIYHGNVVAVFIYKEIDSTAEEIYNNEWVKEFIVEKFRMLWGSNLRKYKGMKLPGGVEFNGEEIYKEAKENIKELKEELETKYQEPPDLFIG